MNNFIDFNMDYYRETGLAELLVFDDLPLGLKFVISFFAQSLALYISNIMYTRVHSSFATDDSLVSGLKLNDLTLKKQVIIKLLIQFFCISELLLVISPLARL